MLVRTGCGHSKTLRVGKRRVGRELVRRVGRLCEIPGGGHDRCHVTWLKEYLLAFKSPACRFLTIFLLNSQRALENKNEDRNEATALLIGIGSCDMALAASYTITDLGTLGGGISVGLGVNNAGQVTGYSRDASGATRAFLYRDGVMTNLGTLNVASSLGRGINDAGQVLLAQSARQYGMDVALAGEPRAQLPRKITSWAVLPANFLPGFAPSAPPASTPLPSPAAFPFLFAWPRRPF